MIDLALNSDHDIYITDRDLTLIDGASALKQRLKIRFWSFYQEWYLNRDFGLPYYQGILGKPTLRGFLETKFRNMILDTPGVEELLYFEMNYENSTRELTIRFDVRSEDGEVSVVEIY